MIADGDDKTANPRNGSGKSITRGPTFDFHRRNSGNTKQHSPKRANSNGALYSCNEPSLGIASRRRGMISGRGSNGVSGQKALVLQIAIRRALDMQAELEGNPSEWRCPIEQRDRWVESFEV